MTAPLSVKWPQIGFVAVLALVVWGVFSFVERLQPQREPNAVSVQLGGPRPAPVAATDVKLEILTSAGTASADKPVLEVGQPFAVVVRFRVPTDRKQLSRAVLTVYDEQPGKQRVIRQQAGAEPVAEADGVWQARFEVDSVLRAGTFRMVMGAASAPHPYMIGEQQVTFVKK